MDVYNYFGSTSCNIYKLNEMDLDKYKFTINEEFFFLYN